jgi:hypothetical protein
VAVFTADGFKPVVCQVVNQIAAPDWSAFVEKSALRADSLLARLSDDDFNRGLAVLRTSADKIDVREPVMEEVDWFVFHRAVVMDARYDE